MKKSKKPEPETLMKHRKRVEAWSAQKASAEKKEEKRLEEKKRIIFKRAEQYVKEYREQEQDLKRLSRVARLEKGFYVPPEPKLAFVIRIKGIRSMHPKSRKILQLLRLRQLFNGVFIRINKATVTMLRLVEPYITWGYPSRKTVSQLIYKRGYGKVNGNRIPLKNNEIIEDQLGKFDIICIEDLVHEIVTVGEHFKDANNFLWPFKLKSPKNGLKKKRKHFVEGGQSGNREDLINDLIQRMN
eukprot:g3026.t1